MRESRHRMHAFGISVIFFFWAALYLPLLRTSPPWYGDEFFTLNVGLPMTHGELTNRALYSTFFSYAFNYQPFFAFLAGLFSRITAGDILGGRFLCALIGLGTAMTGFWFLHRRFGFFCGLFFAVFFLSYPQSIIHYRWIYPHGMVGLAIVGAVGLLMRPARLPQDWKAGLVLILGVGSHLLGVYATAAAVFCRLLRPKSWLPVILPSALFLLLVFFSLNSLLNGWPAEDLSILLRNYEADSENSGRGMNLIHNFLNFFLQDYFHISALVGFFLCLRRRSYMFCVVAFTMSFLLLRNRQNLTFFYYQAIVILPLLACIVAVGLCGLVRMARRRFAIEKRFVRAAQSGLCLFCLLFGLSQLPAILGERLPVRISDWVVDSIPDYEAAAKWLNQETNPSDLVMVHWNLGWMLQCRNADVLMATAWSGQPAGNFFEPPPGRERFRYPVDIQGAKFFVITRLDEMWTFQQKSVPLLLETSGVSTWPIVFQAGTVRVLKNPRL
jgi:hypothetical protein